MAASKLILFFIFCSLFLCVELKVSWDKELDLEEGSPCVTKGVKGLCVNVYRCGTATWTYVHRNGGFREDEYHFPDLPDICSYKNNYPIVCCTDCTIQNETWAEATVNPGGTFTYKNGKPAHDHCGDYFHNLPYRCRGKGNVAFQKIWNEKKKCHDLSFDAALPVGGRDALKWEFPHMALLGYGNDVDSAQWFCGGSVISERFILTAGHCTSTNTLGPIKFAALGLLKRSEPKENWKIYNINRIIIHPEYKSPSKYHDIALLQTETEINFGRDLLPACLYLGGTISTTAEAAGWGRLGHKKPLADNLQVVELNEFSESDCSYIYQPHRTLKQGYDHQTQMCFGSKHNISDTCEGDSGGPVQIHQLECLFTVVGVTSYGKECGIRGNAGIYTRVSYYVPWIESIVWPQ